MTLPSEPSYPIADLRALLSQRVGLDLSPIELAEIFWLALQKGEVVAEDSQSQRSPEPPAQKGIQEQLSRSSSEPVTEEPSSASSAAVVMEPPKRIEEGEEPPPTAGTALSVNIPEAVALRNRQEIARSLRPLMRKVPSKLRQAIDEEATVIQIAETQTWSPVVKPEPERWLELAIVIEVTNLLDVWRDTIAEFQQLMERHGAFRNVRTWQLKPNAAGDPQLFLQTAAGLRGSARSPRELLDAGGRRLILLLSDCTSRAWRSGKIPKLLELWSRENPVTIVQLLPEHYWDRSALKASYSVALRSRRPGALSRDWAIDGLSPRRRQQLPEGLKLPVVTMQPESFGQWARAIAAIDEQQTTGVVLNLQVLPTQDFTPPATPLTAKQLVQRFRNTASEKAQELADMMAVLPVNWSVIRLIQKSLSQESEEPWQPTGALYLAEIFLSGLLCPEPLATESSNKRQKMPQYDFVDGVRALLQGTIPISEAQAVGEEVAEAVFKQLPPDVQQRVNADIERRFGDALSYFEAFLIPDLPWGDSAATEIFPFARVTGQMMQLWGGAYAALVEDLESCREESGQQPSKQPIDEIEALVALDQHMEAIRRQIAETFSEQEHDFGLNIHPREEAALGAIEEIILEDGEISVETFEQNLIERSQEYVSFEVSVRINFSVQIRYFDFDAHHPETEDVPTFGDTVPHQTVDGVAEITLWFAEEDRNEAEPELVRLRVEQPILINPTPPEVDSFSIPTLQTFEFEMATIAFAETSSPEIALEPFEFEIVTIARQNRSTVQPTTELRFDHFLRTLEEEIAAETGHGFNDLEREVLTGALQGKSYKEIHREVSFIGYDHLMRNVGPKLWDRLSEATGEQVTKKNLLILCQQWLSLRKETDWRDLSQQLEDWQPNQFNLEELLDAVNGAILQSTDTTLNNEQQAILVGSLQGMTYKEIRARFWLSASVTRLTGIGNNLWKLLSNATGEQVTKDDLRGSLKQWLNRQEEGEALTFERQQGQSQQFIEDLGNGVTLEMVQIPGGSFVMGSPKNEAERRENESPHPVSLTGFFMGKYAVTQAQWQAVAAMPQVNQALNPDPSRFKGNDRPVEKVSWHDAVEFCNRLSHHTGKQYRLPSEAEWEYACRASPVASAGSFRAGEAVGSGAATPFHFGETITPELANYDGNYTYGSGPKGVYRAETTPVGGFPANAFGLSDMHGNVWEWCLDHWHGTYKNAPTDGSAWIDLDAATDASRVLRGGSWSNDPRFCRSATRDYFNPGFGSYGFRVVCAAPSTL